MDCLYNDYTEVAGDFAAWLRYYKVPLLDWKLFETNGLTQQGGIFPNGSPLDTQGSF